MQYVTTYMSPIGGMTLASDGTALTGLWFDGQKYFGAGLTAACKTEELPVFGETRQWLDWYFCGKQPDFMPKLFLNASPFRLAVWEILREIPFGKTVTYQDIADELARRRIVKSACAQAVGGGVGHNPVSVLIPCHRVVGSDKSLTGYAGGLDKKIALLRLEGADMTGLFVPVKREPIGNR